MSEHKPAPRQKNAILLLVLISIIALIYAITLMRMGLQEVPGV